MVVSCQHVHAGLLAVIILVVMLGALDELCSEIRRVLPFLLELPFCKSVPRVLLSDVSFLGDAVLERVTFGTVLPLLFVELRDHGYHLGMAFLTFVPIAAESKSSAEFDKINDLVC